MEDLKGLKIRSHGTSAKVVKALGGTPVAKAMNESYQLLQKGVVDGSVHPMEANKGWKLGEVIDFFTGSYSAAYTTGFFVVMNKDKWEALPENIQKIIQEINQEWIVKTGQAWDQSEEEGRRFLEEKHVEMIALSDQESARWAEAVRPILDEYVEKTNQRGLSGELALKTAQEAIEKYRPMFK